MFISSESWLRENHKRQTAKLITNKTHTHTLMVMLKITAQRKENSMFFILNVHFRIIRVYKSPSSFFFKKKENR